MLLVFRRSLLWVVVVLVILVADVVVVVHAQEQDSGVGGGGASTRISSSSLPSVDELDQLSDHELETICTDLGFSLLQETEDGTPLVLTHADYVEAARQCLSVQEQMQEILEENPELMQEYMEERDRMVEAELAEQERLLAKKAQLEQELERQQKQQTSSGVGSTAAFVGGKSADDNNSDNKPLEDSMQNTLPLTNDDNDDLVAQVLAESSSSVSSSSSDKRIEGVIDKMGSVLNRILPDRAKEALERVVPKPTQARLKVLLVKIILRIQKDGATALKFAKRQLVALVGRVAQKMEERAARQQNDADSADDSSES